MTISDELLTSGVRPLARQQLADEVRRVIGESDQWASRVRMDLSRRWYERLHLAENYEIWLITWMPGQSTGFHDHGVASGAFAVAWGVLDEYVVTGAARRGADQVAVLPVRQGMIRSFSPEYIHDVRNTTTDTVAVSVHAYSPPLSRMTQYALTPSGLVVSGVEGEDDW